MEPNDWRLDGKPFDLRDRLFRFACVVVRLVKFLHTQGPIATALSYQVLKAGTSAGANYEEADDGSGPRDKRAKKRIVLRELKETLWRLRVLRASAFLNEAHDPVIREAAELVRIVASVLRNTADE
jgi:four helix bundle protein